MPVSIIDNRCHEFFGMGYQAFLDRFVDDDIYGDKVVHEYAEAVVYQYQNTPYWYMVIDCSGIPGVRIANVWDSSEEA